MELIRNGILFCYMLALFLGVAALTMSLLAGRRNPTELNVALRVFLAGMLIMSLYDMLIYYANYTMFGSGSLFSLRIGSCIIAVLFYLWLEVEQKMAGSVGFRWFNRAAQKYIFLYAAVWLALTVFFSVNYIYTVRWLLLVTDIILLLILLTGSVAYISTSLVAGGSKRTIFHMLTVTAMLSWNYLSFSWGEISVYWGNSAFIREPLDLTIIFWLVVNTSMLIFVYRKDFVKAYEDMEKRPEGFDLDRRMEEMAGIYEMTNREKELCRLIYEGKSNSQIDGMLFISESTVKTHIYNIFRKLDVRNRVGVTRVIRGENEEKK